MMPPLTSTLALLALACVAAEAPAAEAPVVTRPRGNRLGAVCKLGVVGGSIGLLAAPTCRQAVVSRVRRLLQKDDESVSFDPEPPSASEAASPPAPRSSEPEVSETAASATTAAAAPAETPGQATADDEGEKFALTPERLQAIATLNPQLDKIKDQLAAVPVFTAAVGNGTSPLTVPGEDGQKLAYFFTESADAEQFLQAVMEHTGTDLDAQVIGVSLSDIIKAYSNPAAVAAKETFVLIPTMAEVGAARQLIKGSEQPKPQNAAALGPGNGLVPIFWSETLAVQAASGKQRKVLFFRL